MPVCSQLPKETRWEMVQWSCNIQLQTSVEKSDVRKSGVIAAFQYLKVKYQSSKLKDNKKGFFKYLNSKRQARKCVGPLLDEHGHLTNRDIDKAEMFNTFFTSVFNTDDGLWEFQRTLG